MLEVVATPYSHPAAPHERASKSRTKLRDHIVVDRTAVKSYWRDIALFC